MRFRDFRLLIVGGVVSALGSQMLGVAVGWELYERTNSSLALGIVGLVQVAPVILLSLLAGQIADRYDRRRIVMLTQFLLALCALGLAAWSYAEGRSFGPSSLLHRCGAGVRRSG
ncbi:MAG: MFS transporter [Chloroflexia bacterium]